LLPCRAWPTWSIIINSRSSAILETSKPLKSSAMTHARITKSLFLHFKSFTSILPNLTQNLMHTLCSSTSAIPPIQNTVQFRRRGITKEKKQHWEHGESLKSKSFLAPTRIRTPEFFSPLPNPHIPPPTPHRLGSQFLLKCDIIYYVIILIFNNLYQGRFIYFSSSFYHKNLCSAAMSFLSNFFVISLKMPSIFFFMK